MDELVVCSLFVHCLYTLLKGILDTVSPQVCKRDRDTNVQGPANLDQLNVGGTIRPSAQIAQLSRLDY